MATWRGRQRVMEDAFGDARQQAVHGAGERLELAHQPRLEAWN
jgi:hypothetical protein